ncbi:MAG: hypothetical protein AAFP86_10485, partial [Planctomycetota bacterium]
DLEKGLQNRVVIAVQSVVARQTRQTVTDVDAMCDAIRRELEPVEDQWGVRILKFGFSNISPSPTTLEITQLELLTGEKRRLYGDLRGNGMSEEAAVALVSGAVVSVHPDEAEPLRRDERAADAASLETLQERAEEQREDDEKKRAIRKRMPGLEDPKEAEPFDDDEDDQPPPLGPGGGPPPGGSGGNS